MKEKIKDLLEENKKMLKKLDKEIEELLGEEKINHKQVYLRILNDVRDNLMRSIERLESTEAEIARGLFNGLY